LFLKAEYLPKVENHEINGDDLDASDILLEQKGIKIEAVHVKVIWLLFLIGDCMVV
jgi:hypothetical protein